MGRAEVREVARVKEVAARVVAARVVAARVVAREAEWEAVREAAREVVREAEWEAASTPMVHSPYTPLFPTRRNVRLFPTPTYDTHMAALLVQRYQT